MDDLPIIRDTLGAPPLDGDSIMLRTAPGQISPLSHEQLDHNLYLLAKQAISNYNARQGDFVDSASIKDGALQSRHFQDGQIPPNAISDAFQQALVPPGTLFPYAGLAWQTTNTDFLLCDGAWVSRERYANLYSAISTVYDDSPPDGKFRLPDLRGRYVVGALGQAENTNTRVECQISDDVYGEEKHALTAPEMPTHTHSFVSFASAKGGGRHGPGNTHHRGSSVRESDTFAKYNTALTPEQRSYISANGDPAFREKYPDVEPYSGSRPGVFGDWTGSPAGPGENEPHTNVPPSIAVNYLIKT